MDLAARYRRFAAEEARGRSPLYEALANGVAGDDAALRFLLTLPPAKQQPNLLLAAMRHLHGVAPSYGWFRDRLLGDLDAVRAVMLARSTQTNEPNRCVVLLPVLARLPQPLALLEVGTSAGLCLLPDRYGYDYGATTLNPAGQGHPVLPCAADAATPLPSAMPRIAWRAGIDLNPIDAADPEQAAWLETLVWPEQADRLALLRAALAIAAVQRPRIVQGDLLGDVLPRLCAEAPRDATLVVFHTAVLAYVADLADREAFAARMAALAPYWISNEASAVFPAVAARAGPPPAPGRFLLAVNGIPHAWTDPHGAAMEWIAPAGA
jgi:hypothetical protein